MQFKITEPVATPRKPFDLTLELRTEADAHQLVEMLRAVPELKARVLAEVKNQVGMGM
jgi:hypothetical protein